MKKKCFTILLTFVLVLNYMDITAYASCLQKADIQDINQSGGRLLKEKVNDLISEEYKQIKQFESNGLNDTQLKCISKLNSNLGDASEKTNNPDFYSGIFVDEDNNIVVNVKDPKDTDILRLKQYCDNADYKIKDVKYSLSHLKAIRNHIVDLMRGDSANCVSEEFYNRIIGVGIQIKENAVKISVKNLNDSFIKRFREVVSDDGCIEFENGAEAEASSSLQPGQYIFVYTNPNEGYGYSYSLGCKVVWIDGVTNDKYGFTTAGHNNSIGQDVYISNTISSENRIGYICRSYWTGNLDAAFVHVDNSNYTLSDVIYGIGSSLTPGWYYPSVVEGMTISKYGATTGYTTGTISSSSYTLSYDGVTISDLIESTATCSQGDSGGIAWAYDSSNGALAVVGMTAATNGISGYYMKYATVRVSLGLHVYS